jgi:hypothetical protein
MKIDYKCSSCKTVPSDSIMDLIRTLNIHPLDDETLEFFMEVFKEHNKDPIINLNQLIIVPILSKNWDDHIRRFSPFTHFMSKVRMRPSDRPQDKYRN